MVMPTLVTGILSFGFDLIKSRLLQRQVPASVASTAAAEAVEVIHNDPTVALVRVKSSWKSPTAWVSVLSFVGGLCTVVVDIITGSGDTQGDITAAIMAAVGLFI